MVLAGLNGVGKSMILEALNLLNHEHRDVPMHRFRGEKSKYNTEVVVKMTKSEKVQLPLLKNYVPENKIPKDGI